MKLCSNNGDGCSSVSCLQRILIIAYCLRWVMDHGLYGINEIFGLHGVKIEDDSSPFGTHVDHVVRLVSKQGDSHHRYPMVDSFIHSIRPTMSDEGLGLWVTWRQSRRTHMEYIYICITLYILLLCYIICFWTSSFSTVPNRSF